MDSDDQPCSLPCSAPEAKIGMPAIVQLHLVDAGLKKNPHPRENFGRQYSVTPERQTPEGDRTPPPPPYSPGKALQIAKDWALGVAKSLKQWHAGRVMIKQYEAEQHRDLEKDLDYWESKTKDWEDEIWRLMVEMGGRKQQELDGKAPEGYAKAMLLSPLLSPSSQALDPDFLEVIQPIKKTTPASNGSPEISTRPSNPYAAPSQGTVHPTTEKNLNDSSTPRRAPKRKRTELEDNEEVSSTQSDHTKHQRRETPTVQQEQELVADIESTQSPVTDTSNNKPKETQNLTSVLPKASLAQPSLPWKLRSRNAVSYRETGSGPTIRSRGHQGKEKVAQRKPRRLAKRSYGRGN